MKKLLLLLAMAIMVIGLVAGCGKSADNGGDKKSGTIGFSVSTLNNPFFVTMKEGVEAQAKALGLKVKIVDAQNDPAKQANDISDLLESGVSVLIINPVDSAAISTSVEAAFAASTEVEIAAESTGLMINTETPLSSKSEISFACFAGSF